MAFFKFRKGGEDPSAPSPQSGQPESVEAMRRRARQRLIGAAVLVLAGVIGFPLVFDTQPRPIAVDIPIDIPDRAKSKPAGAAAPAATPAAGLVEAAPPVPAKAEAAVPAPAAPAAPAAAVAPVVPAVSPAASAPAAAPVAKAASKAEARVDPKDHKDPKADAAHKPSGDGDRAKALLEGKPAAAAPAAAASAADARFVVQVGAFADPAKAAAARSKLEKAGLKTYTHVAETKEGKRTRVRVGPFGTRTEADKAAAKVKGLELPASVLTL
ncbi:SPOR domain-containing protein [Ramlibacter sp. MAHUQ-53]|uniref:SPOR domain-containing protein n=1 Tax=unclassified Ramlibacter TaxID=2617605 RepID=UPI00362506B6